MGYPKYEASEAVEPSTNRQVALMAAVASNGNMRDSAYYSTSDRVISTAREYLKFLEDR